MVMLQSRPELVGLAPQSVCCGMIFGGSLDEKNPCHKKHDGIPVTFFGVKMVFLRKKSSNFFSLKSWVLQGETSKTTLAKKMYVFFCLIEASKSKISLGFYPQPP